MSSYIRKRLNTAWGLTCVGAFYQAAEILLFGEIEDKFEIQSQKPLIQEKNWSHFLRKVGVDFFPHEVFSPGAKTEFSFENIENISLGIDIHRSHHQANIEIETPHWVLGITLRQNPETNLFTLDEAHLVQYAISWNDQPGGIHDRMEICVEDYHHGKEILMPFLEAFNSIGRLIVENNSIDSQAFESFVNEKVNPIVRVASRQRREVHEIRAQSALQAR